MERTFLKHFESSFSLNEKYSSDYENKMIDIFNKALRDELEASISYKIMAEQIQGPGINQIKSELESHGAEEYAHFTEFVSYAAKHNLLNRLKFEIRTVMVDPNVLPKDAAGIVQFSQDLETEAMQDYKNAAKVAQQNNDNETRMFFEDKMKAEMTHYDDISDLDDTKRARRIGE